MTDATLHYDDLNAIVTTDATPEGACAAIEELYSSLFSTCDWFESHDDEHPTGSVTLEDPRHLLLFYQAGDTIEVLNKVIDMRPADVRRAGSALLRAFPAVRRIHLEVKFPPDELHVPKRVLYWTDDYVIELPGSVEEYLAGLGASTRRNLRRYEKRLRRDFPDCATEVVVPGADAQAIFDRHLEWKLERFRSLGKTTIWEELPDRIGLFIDLLKRRGEAHITSLAGRPAGIAFIFPVGSTLSIYANAFDPEYEYYHLGLLMQYWVVTNAIARGMTRVHLFWGTPEYKTRLGALPVRGTRVSLFRSRASKLYSLPELGVIVRRRYNGAREWYWDARRAARLRFERLARRTNAGEKPTG